MELLIGHHMDNGGSSSGSGGSGGSGAACVAATAVDLKNNGGAVLTKDQRVEKGRFMNRVANMNPERRLKKLLSDRYANMSEERRAKKKESNRLLNRPENMSLERRMRKRLSDSAAHMSAERKEKKKESQRKRNLSKIKVPRVPLSIEKREQKNERGKMRRAAKKAATKTGKFGQMDAQTNVQLPEISVSATPASSSLSMPQLMEELSAPCGITVGDVVGTVSHDVQIVHVNNSNNNSINDTNDRTIAYADDGNDVTHPPNESDSDSDKDENDEDDNIHNENISCTNNLHHTIAAAVPVEDEMDRNDLINNLRRNNGADSSDNSIKERSTGRGNDYNPISLSIQSPLSLSESLTKLDYKEENDSNNAQTSNPLSRKRNRSAKDK